MAVTTYPVETIAKLLDLTPRRVQQLSAQGVIPKSERGQYDLVGAVKGYIGFLKAETHKLSRVASHSRVVDARAREIELRNAETEAKLIELEEHDALVDEGFGMLKTALSGLPARITRDLPMRRKIEDEINGVLHATSERFLERSKVLRETGVVLDAQPEDDAG